MKKILTFIAALGAFCNAFAQLYLPMEPQDNYVIEQTTQKQYWVNGALFAASVEGVSGRALRLDGYSTYIEVPTTYYGFSNEQLTMQLWCAVETYPMVVLDIAKDEWTDICGTLDETARTGWAFRLSSQGRVSFVCYSNYIRQNIEFSGRMPKYEWVHLAATFDAEARKLAFYLNGEKVGEKNLNGMLDAGVAPLLIGKSKKDVFAGKCLLNTFNGIIDEVKVENTILSSAAIQSAAQTSQVPNLTDRDTIFNNNFYRPRFHAMPSMGWTNECHGLYYSGGKYHLFSQKNGNGTYMSRLHWGHYSSADLLHWQEERIAIAPDKSYDIKGCWSGAVFADSAITGGQPWIVYTGVDNSHASIDFAMPQDSDLLIWTKAQNNPQIAGTPAGYDADFRDPYFFRNGDDAYIFVGTKQNGVAANSLHKYVNGSWQHVGTFFRGQSAAIDGDFNEMCNVTPLGDGRWLFTATPLGSNRGVRTIYWVGELNSNGEFTPYDPNPKTVELYDMATDGYGLLSPTVYYHNGKLLALGIVPDKLSDTYTYSMGFSHCMSFPREWSVDAEGNLIQRPYEGIQALRTDSNVHLTDTLINATTPLTPVSGRQWEVKIKAVVGTAGFGLRFLKNPYNSATLSYVPNTNTLRIDLSKLNVKNNGRGNYSAVLPFTPAVGDTLTLDIYFDNSILEIFINERYAQSIRLFCSDYNANDLEIYTLGNVQFAEISAWGLEEMTQYSRWKSPQKPKDYDPDKGCDLSSDASTHTSGTTKFFEDGQVMIAADKHIYTVNGIQIQ